MSDGCVYYGMWMFSYMLGCRFWHTIVAWLEAGISGDFPLDSLYNKYCERILVFHKIIMQLMKIHVKYVAGYGWPDAIILAMFILCV
jgi:hypothetical protein